MEKISTYIHTWATAEIKADHSDQVECRRSFERSATSASACNMLESSFGRQARFRKEMRNWNGNETGARKRQTWLSAVGVPKEKQVESKWANECSCKISGSTLLSFTRLCCGFVALWCCDSHSPAQRALASVWVKTCRRAVTPVGLCR